VSTIIPIIKLKFLISTGIGYAVAEASIESGASVTISSSSISKVESSIAALKKSYPSAEVSGYSCDLSKPTVEQDLELLFKQTGKVEHIVYTAGSLIGTGPINECTYESILQAGQVRFVAPLLLAKVGSKYLNPGPTSSIVFTTGLVADRPIPNWSVIASYAAGLHGMTRTLAVDLQPIRVNIVSPGLVDTNLWQHLSAEEKEGMMKNLAGKAPTAHVAQRMFSRGFDFGTFADNL
jgi:NAD(P)-dependent dehydrogenase (short-subunit alcohol dehydrogenase family)